MADSRGNAADTRYDALELAVKLAGSPSRRDDYIPPSPQTVVRTAKIFHDYLENGVVPEQPEKKR